MQLDAEKLIDVLAEQIGSLPVDTAIVGIHTGGAWVAEALAARLGIRTVGSLAVTLHRDDFATRGLHPQRQTTDISFTVEGAHILLVDDVLQSGRTVRAALNELFDFGRPRSIKLAVLIDRGGRELPFAADYTAMSMPLDRTQSLVLSRDSGTHRFDIQES